MKFLDSVGGRKFTGFVIVAVMAYAGLWFGKLDGGAFQTIILGDLAVYVGGNLGDYQINKNTIGGKKK